MCRPFGNAMHRLLYDNLFPKEFCRETIKSQKQGVVADGARTRQDPETS